MIADPAPPEARASLLALAAPPLAWAAHFLLSYGTAAVYCAKLAGAGGSLGAARWAITAYTAAALAVVAWLGWRGYLLQRSSAGARHAGSVLASERFLGFTALLLACLSELAIAYGALVILFVRDCR
jgi:hypothetical protein